MKDFRSGDVIYVNLGHHANCSIQSGMRPCVVLSNNKSNRYSTNLSVCPFSGQLKDNPVHVKVKPSDGEGYL